MSQNLLGKQIGDEIDEEQKEKIRDLIDKQKIKGISIDTTAFGRNATDLKAGLISQLSQFDESHPAKLVISEVIWNEVQAHLCESLTELRGKTEAGIKAGRKLLGAENPILQQLSELLNSKNPEDIAASTIEEFMAACHATKLDLDSYTMPSDIFKRYFSKKPPFQLGKNKSEFPDAAALVSIESWADHNDTEVLIVSRDKAWEAFATESPRLHLVKKLSTALSLFQKHDDFLENFLNVFKDEIKDQQSSSYFTLESALWGEDWLSNTKIENLKEDAGFIVEEVNFGDVVQLKLEDQNSIEPVRVEKDCVHVEVSFFLSATFDIQILDSTFPSTSRKSSQKRIAEIMRNGSCHMSAHIKIPFKRVDSDIEVHIEPFDLTLSIGDISAEDWYEDDDD
ncbi:hypothetical protein DZB54_01005 [Herbaspirillum sp. 3R-3a1]|nr:hypothetical protein DZB54_01005 [Herbaspirillum sp. 3R-3a1]